MKLKSLIGTIHLENDEYKNTKVFKLINLFNSKTQRLCLPSNIMADELLPEGLRFFNKKDTQPDFVVGALVVTMNDLFNFCKQNPDLITDYQGKKQLKLQILKSTKGNLYAKVDTWKPDAAALPSAPIGEATVIENIESLPF